MLVFCSENRTCSHATKNTLQFKGSNSEAGAPTPERNKFCSKGHLPPEGAEAAGFVVTSMHLFRLAPLAQFLSYIEVGPTSFFAHWSPTSTKPRQNHPSPWRFPPVPAFVLVFFSRKWLVFYSNTYCSSLLDKTVVVGVQKFLSVDIPPNSLGKAQVTCSLFPLTSATPLAFSYSFRVVPPDL